MTQSAIIIGAGYGGMALANLLAKAGYKVSVYEKNETYGGRIAAIKQNGYTFDIGPSWYLMPEVFEHYYDLFGYSAQERLDLVRFKPGYKVFFENQDPLQIQGDIAQDKHTFDRIEPGAGSTLERYVAKSSFIYQLAIKHFLYNNFSRPVDVLRVPVMRHALSLLYLTSRTLNRHVSRYFRDKRLKQLLEYFTVFLGSSPFQAPAVYSLMSHLDFVSGVYYPRRGMLSVADDMHDISRELGISYHFGADVQEILVEGKRAAGIRLSSGDEIRADLVISNADLHFTETTLLAAKHQSYPDRYWRKRQPGPGALLISLGIKGGLPNLLHHNLFFVDAWKENFHDIYDQKKVPQHASIYVCNPTKTDASLAPEGHENLFFLVPIPAGIELNAAEQEALAERSIADFAKVANIPDMEHRILEKKLFGPKDFGARYNAWEYNAFGGESHLLRQSILFRTRNKSRKVQDLYYVGAGTLPGIGLPMCLISAQLTYKRIIGDRSPGALKKEKL